MEPMQALSIFRAALALYGLIIESMLTFIDSLPSAISELKAPMESQAQTISFWSSAISMAIPTTVCCMAIFYTISLALFPTREKEKSTIDIGIFLLFSTVFKDAILYRSQDLSFWRGVFARIHLVHSDSANAVILPSVIFALVTVYHFRRQGRVVIEDEESRLAPLKTAEVDLKEQPILSRRGE